MKNLKILLACIIIFFLVGISRYPVQAKGNGCWWDIFEDVMVFIEGRKNASRVFSAAIGKSGSFTPVEYRKHAEGQLLPTGHRVEVVVIQCTGTAFVKSIIPIFHDFVITTNAAAQTKFSTSR